MLWCTCTRPFGLGGACRYLTLYAHGLSLASFAPPRGRRPTTSTVQQHSRVNLHPLLWKLPHSTPSNLHDRKHAFAVNDERSVWYAWRQSVELSHDYLGKPQVSDDNFAKTSARKKQAVKACHNSRSVLSPLHACLALSGLWLA